MPLRRNNSPPVHTDWQPKPRRLRRAAPEAARSSTNEATPTLANCSMYCIGQTNFKNESFIPDPDRSADDVESSNAVAGCSYVHVYRNTYYIIGLPHGANR